MTDLLTSGERGLRKWNQRADLGGYGGGGGQVRTSRPAWQGRRKGWSRHGVQGQHPGLFIRSPGTAGVRAVGTDCLCHPRPRKGRQEAAGGRPQGVSKREREAGQKRGLQTWRDAKQKQMTFLSSSMICLIKPVWDRLLADRLTLEDRWCYHTTSESCIVRKTPQSY